jgi:phospholipid/cholesterol/gamma-HCH transport system substrate-binding protein
VNATTPSRRRLLVAAIGILIGAFMVSGCKFNGAYDLPLPGSPVDKNHAIEITAEFADVLNLVPRSPVKVNDVTVGEVTDIWRLGWHAGVRMRIQDDVKLPANAIADIQQTSLLGEKYVALMPAPGEKATGRLSNGADIPISDTGRDPAVEDVLGALSFLLNGGGVGQLKTITTELNKVMDGRQQDLRHLLGQLDTLAGTLDQQKGDIIRAMQAINGLTATLNKERGTIVKAIDTIGPAVKVLADQRRQLMTMLRSLDRLGVVGTRVITATKANTLADLQHLQPILAKLNKAGEALPKAIELLVSFPFPKQASTIVKGDYANTAIAMDLSLGNIMLQLEKKNKAPQLPGQVCKFVPEAGKKLCGDLLQSVLDCLKNPSPTNPACAGLPQAIVGALCKNAPGPLGGLCAGGGAPTPAGLTQVQKCLKNPGTLTKPSKVCQKVLSHPKTAKKLQKQCKKKKNKDNPICKTIKASTLPGGGLPTAVPGVPVLPRAAFGASRTDSSALSGVPWSDFDFTTGLVTREGGLLGRGLG